MSICRINGQVTEMSALTDIGLGTLFAGNAGLLQLTVLPGLLAHEWQARNKIHMPALDSLLFMFTFSAVVSFVLVLLLQLCGLHTKVVWMLLGWGQLALGLYWHYTNRSPPGLLRPDAQRLPLPGILGLLVYLFCLIGLLRTVVGHWPGVLEGWDAIVSWNRWAKDWSAGVWPALTWDYPQLMPADWSVLYLWQGSSEIEIFVRIWMGLFAVALMAVFLAMYAHWRRWPLLLAGAVMSGILLGPYRQWLDSGYVDVPLTFAILLTAHWAMLAVYDASRSGRWLIYATVATALALLTKQGGLMALLMWLWALWCLRAQTALTWRAVGLLLVLVLPWYLLAQLHDSHDSVFAYVTRDIYGKETLSARVVRALIKTLPVVTGVGASTRLAAVIVFVGICGFVIALRDRCGRFFTVTGIGGLLVWAASFSYDGRNLLPALPLLLLAVAHGFGRMQLTPAWLSESLPMGDLKTYQPLYKLIPILSVVVLVGTWLPANVARWEHLTNSLRKASGIPALNGLLLDFVSTPEFSGLVYTTYPSMAAIVELREHWFNDFGASHMQPQTAAALQSGAPLCEVFATIPHHEDITYVLLHDSVYPDMVNQALSQGTLRTIMSVPGVKLMRVQCPLGSLPQ